MYFYVDFDWMSTFQQDWEMSNRIHEDSGVRCVCVRSGEWYISICTLIGCRLSSRTGRCPIGFMKTVVLGVSVLGQVSVSNLIIMDISEVK